MSDFNWLNMKNYLMSVNRNYTNVQAGPPLEQLNPPSQGEGWLHLGQESLPESQV